MLGWRRLSIIYPWVWNHYESITALVKSAQNQVTMPEVTVKSDRNQIQSLFWSSGGVNSMLMLVHPLWWRFGIAGIRGKTYITVLWCSG